MWNLIAPGKGPGTSDRWGKREKKYESGKGKGRIGRRWKGKGTSHSGDQERETRGENEAHKKNIRQGNKEEKRGERD